MRTFICLIVAFFLCTSIGFADAPATRPTTPTEAYQLFLGALSQGNPDEVKILCGGDDADSKAIAASLIDLATSIQDLRKSVTAKFGAFAADAVLPVMGDSTAETTETVDGDHASVESVGGQTKLPFIKLDGQWKVDLAQLKKDGIVGPHPDLYVKALTRIVRKTSTDIQAGKYADAITARDAMRALQEGIDDTPATQP